MEEVDSIILHFLRQLNINIDDQITNICELPVEIIIKSASTCLTAINQSLKVPKKLPAGISHRIEVAAQIASICKDLGYKNDVGYQTFLYHNECELRQVFMFLIERLPTEGKQGTPSSAVSSSEKSLLMQNIANKIGEELNCIWIPPCCQNSSQTAKGDFLSNQEYFVNSKSSKISLSEHDIVLKLLKAKERKNNDVESPQFPQYDIKEESNNEEESNHRTAIVEINASLKELKELAIMHRQKLDTLESEKNLMEVEYSQAQKFRERSEAELRNIQNILNSIGLSDIEHENIDDNNLLEKVQKNINRLHRNNEEITSRNLSLKVDIEKLKNNMNDSESERTRCIRILSNLKAAAKALKEEYDNKEELSSKLKASYAKLRGGNKRSIYTKRILEIISNVDKQNMEIKKILDDTRQLQKEINTLEGQLDRCFSIADETLFKDAKKDDQAKKAYKLLALLHSECSTIVSLVNDTGMLARNIVDLEDNIKTEKAKRTEDTLKKIQFDFAKMQEESVS